MSHTWAPWMGQLVLRDVVSGWLSPWAEEMLTEERAGVTQRERGSSSLGPGTVAPPVSPLACCPLQHPVLWGMGPSPSMIWNLGPQLLPLAWDPQAGPAWGGGVLMLLEVLSLGSESVSSERQEDDLKSPMCGAERQREAGCPGPQPHQLLSRGERDLRAGVPMSRTAEH